MEKIRIFPPAGQIGPISKLERDTLLRASPIYERYSKRVEERDPRRAFVDRMRAERGLPPIAWSDEEWKEGDFLAFVPRIQLEPEKKPPRRLTTGCVVLLTAFVIFGWSAWRLGWI